MLLPSSRPNATAAVVEAPAAEMAGLAKGNSGTPPGALSSKPHWSEQPTGRSRLWIDRARPSPVVRVGTLPSTDMEWSEQRERQPNRTPFSRRFSCWSPFAEVWMEAEGQKGWTGAQGSVRGCKWKGQCDSKAPERSAGPKGGMEYRKMWRACLRGWRWRR